MTSQYSAFWPGSITAHSAQPLPQRTAEEETAHSSQRISPEQPLLLTALKRTRSPIGRTREMESVRPYCSRGPNPDQPSSTGVKATQCCSITGLLQTLPKQSGWFPCPAFGARLRIGREVPSPNPAWADWKCEDHRADRKRRRARALSGQLCSGPPVCQAIPGQAFPLPNRPSHLPSGTAVTRALARPLMYRPSFPLVGGLGGPAHFCCLSTPGRRLLVFLGDGVGDWRCKERTRPLLLFFSGIGWFPRRD